MPKLNPTAEPLLELPDAVRYYTPDGFVPLPRLQVTNTHRPDRRSAFLVSGGAGKPPK